MRLDLTKLALTKLDLRKAAAVGLLLGPLGACATADGGKPNGLLAFQGTVQSIDNGCFADGVCSVVVDGRTVVTMRGWSRSTWGNRDPEIEVGDAVDVRCASEAGGCTLEGSADYFLRKAD